MNGRLEAARSKVILPYCCSWKRQVGQRYAAAWMLYSSEY